MTVLLVIIALGWIVAHVRLRHKRDTILIEIGKHPNHLNFKNIPFHHWLLKHLPYRLQPHHVRKIAYKHYSWEDALLHFLYHHHFSHVRKITAGMLISLLTISSMTTFILFSPPKALAASNVHLGNAHVYWADSLGTSHSRMTVSTTNSVNNHTDKAWEISPSVSQTLFINQATVDGLAPPALPGGTQGDYCNIFIYYENETTSPVQTFNNVGCPASVNFINTTKAGTYRIRVIFRDCTAFVLGSCTTFAYPEQDSDTSLGTASTNNHKGALRVGMNVTSITVSAYPAGSTFAYGTAGNEDFTITVNHTQPQGTAISEDIRINSRKNGSGTVTENGATKKAASSGSTTQAFTVDSTYAAELAGFDAEIELMGTSPLTGTTWTHINTATSPVVKDSTTIARSPNFFNIDPRISFSGLTTGETVYNRGESSTHSFNLLNARNEQLTKTMNWSVQDSVSSLRTTASGTGPTYSKTYTITSADTAVSTTTGDQWNIITTTADVQPISSNIFSVSDLLRISTVNSGTINHNTLTYRDSGYTTAETVFNRGETVYNQFYLYGVRGQLVVDTSPIGTTLSLQVKNSANSSEGTAVSVSADVNGRVRWNYTPASGHTATNDTTGSPKHFELTKTGNSLRQGSNGTLGSGDEWNVSSLLTVNNIWHSKLQADAAEYNQFSLSGDNMEIRSRIFDVRGNNKSGATVTTYLYKPDTSLSVQWNLTTASDGWTGWRTISAASPVGDWQLKAEATDANSNSAPLSTETITLGTMHDPVRLSVSPLQANPDETVQIVIHESYLSGIAVTGNAANTTVFIYNPSNTLVVNGANPTEIDNGAYRYNYSLGSSPALGNWYAVVRSQIGGSSDIFTSAINFYVENQETIIGNFSINVVGSSTTTFVTTLTSSVDDFYNNGVILFTSGPNNTLVRRISAYTGSTKTVTVDPALPSTPTNGDAFSLLKQTASSGGSGGGATAAEIWAYGSRTLTDGTATVAAQLKVVDEKVNTLQTSVNTVITNTTNIASQVWDALTSAYSTTGSFAKLLQDNIDAAISSRSTQTSVDTIGSNVTTIKTNVNTGTTGSVSDTSPSTSSFKTSLTVTKDDFFKNMLLVFTSGQNNGQSRRISGYNGSTKTITVDPEFSYTPANGNTFIVNVTSTRAEELSGSAKSTIESVQSKLNTLAGTLPSDYKGMYEQLKAVADALAKLGVLKGSGADSLYAVSAENKDDVKYLKNKLLDLQAALEINKLLLVGGKQNAVFSTYYTFNSVVLNMIIANPTSRKAKIPFKAYLPKEAKPEHIISSGGLKVEFEEASGSYITTGEFELDAGESITRQVEMKDIWIIDEGEITSLKKQAEELYNEAKRTAYSSQALILKNDTTTRLDKILREQKESDTTPQEHILTYRDNQQELAVAKDNLKKMNELVTAAGAGRGLLASVGGIQTVATWGIIVVLLAGLAIMSLFFYSMWRHQMMVVAALTSTTGSRRKHLPIGAIEGEIVGGGTSLLSLPNMPKLSVNWKWLLPKLKWLVILLIVSALVITIVKGIIPIKQLGQFFKSDKQQSVVEDKKEVKPTSTPAPTPAPQPKVEILETETGWLNVREEPNKQSKILLKANVGKQYVELGRTNDENGDEWVKIKLDSADQTKVKEGWVFGQYVKIIQK